MNISTNPFKFKVGDVITLDSPFRVYRVSVYISEYTVLLDYLGPEKPIIGVFTTYKSILEDFTLATKAVIVLYT